jgi:hypothetical protein
MSYETGTATTQADLWTKLGTFLVDECEWEELTGLTPAVDGFAVRYFKGPGSSPGDEIFVNMTKFFDIPNDVFGFGFRGARGFNELAHMTGQPFASGEVTLSMWNSPMTYWFFGNGRKFIVWGLPFGSPTQYPYPLAIMAQTSLRTLRFNNETESFRNFWDPGVTGAWLNSPGNAWIAIGNVDGNGGAMAVNMVSPWGGNAVSTIRSAPDGTKPVLQSFIHGSAEGGSHFVFLEDVFWMPGFGGVGPEDTFDLDGDDYIVFNNIFRLQNQDFCAIRIEP